MKTFVLILFGSILLLGCSRQSPKPPQEIKYETMSMDWAEEDDTARSLGFTNHCLLVMTKTSTETNSAAIDVSSLDDAANILGRYGWELVSTETKGNPGIYHMKRQVREDGKKFILTSASAAEFNK